VALSPVVPRHNFSLLFSISVSDLTAI